MSDTPSPTSRNSARTVISGLLSVALAAFLADAGISLLDDSLILGFGIHALGAIRGLVSFFAALVLIGLYLCIGATPMVPKRYFLPLALFAPVAVLATFPVMIYHYARLQQFAWAVSVAQLLLGLCVLGRVQGAWRLRWPLVPVEKLRPRLFSWRNLAGFALANLLVLLPGVFVYLAFCASLAVDHFSEGFLALRTDGLTARARTYVRQDRKSIQLIPMMHIGDADFYGRISKAAPADSVVLLEGVTDTKNLLKHKLRYKRVAKSLGLTEQQLEFAPSQARSRQADVDIAQFSKSTLALLNAVSRVYAEGLSVQALVELSRESQDPFLTERVWDDLLTGRNAHLVREIKAELSRSDRIVVPWGAIHMPGIAREIQESGFQLSNTEEYKVVRFRSPWNRPLGSKKE